MKKLMVSLAIVLLFCGLGLAQQQPANSLWMVSGFVEQQYRPVQDFSATSLWITAKKEKSGVGFFNFSQIAGPALPKRVGYWQTYSGVFAGNSTKAGYVEGGVAAGVEKGRHLRMAVYGYAAPKGAYGITLLMIHEHGLYPGSGFTRIHVQRSLTKWLKAGYHHQTFLGDGVNADIKIPKTPLSVFGCLTVGRGVKSMVAARWNF